MRFLAVISIMLPLLLTGCLGIKAGIAVDPEQLDVFDIVFNSSTDYREIYGVTGTDEPCLRGFERTFDALDIVIGYGLDGRVSKITSRNPQNSMFGVRPGDAFEEARGKIRTAGFAPGDAANRFRREGLVLTLLVDSADRVTGVILETTGI